jgi:hypothetical protein
VSLLATFFAFMNLYAAADLGYDFDPRGQIIIQIWAYSFMGLFCVTGALMVMAARSWYRDRRK